MDGGKGSWEVNFFWVRNPDKKFRSSDATSKPSHQQAPPPQGSWWSTDCRVPELQRKRSRGFDHKAQATPCNCCNNPVATLYTLSARYAAHWILNLRLALYLVALSASCPTSELWVKYIKLILFIDLFRSISSFQILLTRPIQMSHQAPRFSNLTHHPQSASSTIDPSCHHQFAMASILRDCPT